jgi:hypothetical protein
MSPILAILGTIALMIGHAPAPSHPSRVAAHVHAVNPPASHPPRTRLVSRLAEPDDPMRESASLSEQSFEKEDNEDSPLDGGLSPGRPTIGRFTRAQLLSATGERLDGTLSDLRSTCLRC